MKFATIFATLAIAATAVSAFPAYLNDPSKRAEVEEMYKRAIKENPNLLKREKRALTVFPPVIPGRKLIPDQDHQFQAPSATAQRGPCPGLNTMANHGYINREGITNSQELAWGMQEAFALGPGLSEFLAFLATVADGNPVADLVSIGGSDARVPGLLGGPLPGGIGRHNAYEIDASLTRNDIEMGNNFVLNGTLYEAMFQTADRVNKGVLNIQSQAVYRNERYYRSVAENPQFKLAPIGVLFYGADHFLWRTLVSTNADGTNVPCTRESLASTYGAKSLGNGQWAYVPERFPADWYRSTVPYELPEIVGDAVVSLVYGAAHGSLPYGFNPAKASDPAYVACQIASSAAAQVPSSILSLPGVQQLLDSGLNPIKSRWGCA